MANQEHINLLLDGVESWNRQREKEDFEPDLVGENIYEEFEKAGKLNNDGYIPLSNINLRRANLSGAWFHGLKSVNNSADLRDADLRDAVLINTSLMFARLDRAKLCKADLSEALMYKANLENANLSSATLKGTNFALANLTGAELSLSQPWQAKLYPYYGEEPNPCKKNSHDGRVDCVASLIEICKTLKAHNNNEVLYFRGERDTNWKLKPSVMRCTKKGKYSLRSKESEMLLQLMSRRPEDFNETTSALAQLVLAQHHELKTRLLDVTRNPLVALFCACKKAQVDGQLHVFSVPKNLVKPYNSDTVSIIANFCKLSRLEQKVLLGWRAKDIEECETNPENEIRYDNLMGRLYHLIRQEKPNFKELIDPRDFFRVIIVEPQQLFPRIRAQSGAFLISAFHERFEQSEVHKLNAETPLYQHLTFNIPKENKKNIKNELRLLNVTRETLFPGLDASAEAITKFFDNSSI